MINNSDIHFLVSIIIPNYNHADFLEERLASIFNQTFTDYEIILLDDASTDNSVEILKKYANHPKVSHFIINKKNSGSPFKQWKKGIELARGKYIWFAESDDYCDNNFLENLIKAFDDKETVLSYCQSKVVDEKNTVLLENNALWTDDLDKQRWRTGFSNSGINECRDYLSLKNTIPNASAVLFKREAAVNISWEMDKYKMAGDWLFWIKLLQQGKIYFTPEILNYFRHSETNTRIHNSRAKKIKRVKEELWVLEFLRKQNVISGTYFNNRVNRLLNKIFNLIPRKLWRLKYQDLFEFIQTIRFIVWHPKKHKLLLNR